MTLTLPKEITAVSVVFGEESIPYTKNEDGSISFTVPKVDGHAMLTLTY